MFGVGLIELGVLLILLVLLVVGLRTAVRSARRLALAPAGRAPLAPPRERRLVQVTRLAGLGVGLLAAWVVQGRGSYGTGPLLAPAALGLGVLVGVVVGETVVRPRRAPGPRTASLTTRRVRDYAPPALTGAVGLVLVAEVATLVLTTTTAGRDDYTGGMRALTCSNAVVSSARTPYPGSYYSLPLALALLVVLAVAVLAARRCVRRPRGTSADEQGEELLRRRSVTVVVAATGVAAGATYVGIGVVAGTALVGLGGAAPSCAPAWTAPVGTVVLIATLAATAVGGWCALLLTVPATRTLHAAPSAEQAVDSR